MTDKNELSDIVLNKGTSSSSNKKIILAVATLGVILIIVVMLMNSLSSDSADNLPQAVLPPEPQKQLTTQTADEPLFEEVEVMQEDETANSDLDKIAQKLKEESAQEVAMVEEIEEPVAVTKPKKVTKPAKKVTQKAKTITKAVTNGKYYVQVGSFSKYQPNKKFLKSITDLGFNYKFHKVGNLNKVLVGPFKTQKEANSAKRVLRAKVEPGAFSVKL